MSVLLPAVEPIVFIIYQPNSDGNGSKLWKINIGFVWMIDKYLYYKFMFLQVWLHLLFMFFYMKFEIVLAYAAVTMAHIHTTFELLITLHLHSFATLSGTLLVPSWTLFAFRPVLFFVA